MKRSKSKTKDKPSTEVIDYFPRGNTSSHQNDFTFNTGYVDNKKDKTNFLSKKRKTTSHKDNKAQTQLHNENEGVHIEKAIEVTNLNKVEVTDNQTQNGILVKCDYFTTEKITLKDINNFLIFCSSDRSNSAKTRARKASSIRGYFSESSVPSSLC